MLSRNYLLVHFTQHPPHPLYGMPNMTDPQQQLYVPAKQQNTLYPVRDFRKLFGDKLTSFRSLLTVIRTHFPVLMLH